MFDKSIADSLLDCLMWEIKVFFVFIALYNETHFIGFYVLKVVAFKSRFIKSI